jgi:hypothetical protein
MKDVEIKIDITKTTTMTKDDDKRYSNFIRKSFKLFKLREDLSKLETKMETVMTNIAVLEEELMDVLETP